MRGNFKVDYDGLARLVEFQLENGVAGIVAVDTTGESPTLTWREHNTIIERIHKQIAGTGSNNTDETMRATEHAMRVGVVPLRGRARGAALRGEVSGGVILWGVLRSA